MIAILTSAALAILVGMAWFCCCQGKCKFCNPRVTLPLDVVVDFGAGGLTGVDSWCDVGCEFLEGEIVLSIGGSPVGTTSYTNECCYSIEIDPFCSSGSPSECDNVAIGILLCWGGIGSSPPPGSTYVELHVQQFTFGGADPGLATYRATIDEDDCLPLPITLTKTGDLWACCSGSLPSTIEVRLP